MNEAETKLPLIAALNYAADGLGLYRAELARILCLLCRDVSESANLDLLLNDNKRVQKKAERFVFFYELLEARFRNDSAGMVHWFRKYNATLGTTPFHAMVDDNRLEDVIAELAQPAR